MQKPKSIAFFLFTLITATSSFAQETPDVTTVSVFTILNPGFSHERKIGKDQSLYGQIFTNTSVFLGYSSSSLGNMSSISFDPAISAQYRYYYNAERRLAKGKRTALNSMNYLSLVYEATFTDDRISVSDYEEENVRAIHQFGICWGIQRNYASRFSLNLHLGVSVHESYHPW